MTHTLGAGGGVDAVGFHSADAEYSPFDLSAPRRGRSVRQEQPGLRGRCTGLCAITRGCAWLHPFGSRLKVFHVDHASTRGGTTRFGRRREDVMFVPAFGTRRACARVGAWTGRRHISATERMNPYRFDIIPATPIWPSAAIPPGSWRRCRPTSDSSTAPGFPAAEVGFGALSRCPVANDGVRS
jgi:hypothetical protein